MLTNAYVIAPANRLGNQRNALRIEIIEPQSRCTLRPKTDAAVFARARFNWRTDQLSQIWDSFDYCNHNPSGCEGCAFYRRHRERVSPFVPVVAAQDPCNKDTWWLLTAGNGRWGEFGYWYAPTERASGLAQIVQRWAIDI